MAYGIKVVLPNGENMVTALTPVYYLDFITWPESGSRSYNVPSGKSLKVMANANIGDGGKVVTSNATINGNTLTWSNVYERRPLLVYAG